MPVTSTGMTVELGADSRQSTTSKYASPKNLIPVHPRLPPLPHTGPVSTAGVFRETVAGRWGTVPWFEP